MNVTFSARYTNISRSEGLTALMRSRYGRGLPGPDVWGLVRTPAKKGGVRHVAHAVLLPAEAPKDLEDADTLWTASARLERQSNAREARAIDFSIPRAVPERLWLPFAKEIARLFVRVGLPVQVDVEVGIASDGGLHPHVHILIAPRTAGASGLSRTKCRALDKMFHRDKGRVLRRELAEAGNRFLFAHFIPVRLIPLSNAQQNIHPACPRYRGAWEKEKLLPAQAEWRQMRSEFETVAAQIALHERELEEISNQFPSVGIDDAKGDREQVRVFVQDTRVTPVLPTQALHTATGIPTIYNAGSSSTPARLTDEVADFELDPMPVPRSPAAPVKKPGLRSEVLLRHLREWKHRDWQFGKLVDDIRSLPTDDIRARYEPLSAAATALIEIPDDHEGGIAADPADPHTVAQLYMIKYELMGELASRIGASIRHRPDRSRVTFAPAEH